MKSILRLISIAILSFFLIGLVPLDALELHQVESNQKSLAPSDETSQALAGSASTVPFVDGVSPTLTFADFLSEYDITGYEPANTNSETLSSCKSAIYAASQYIPSSHLFSLEDLYLISDSASRRGLGGGATIKIRCQNLSQNEIMAVFIHEMGHIADTGMLQGEKSSGNSDFNDGSHPVSLSDPSVAFYQISWQNERTQRAESHFTDFVSGYAQSDPFEDFAETYLFYVAHGPEFRYLNQFNPKLAQKYTFMRNNVFQGREYGLDFVSTYQPDLFSRYFDATKIPHSLAYLQ